MSEQVSNNVVRRSKRGHWVNSALRGDWDPTKENFTNWNGDKWFESYDDFVSELKVAKDTGKKVEISDRKVEKRYTVSPLLTEDQKLRIHELRSSGKTIIEVSNEVGLNVNLVYNYIRVVFGRTTKIRKSEKESG